LQLAARSSFHRGPCRRLQVEGHAPLLTRPPPPTPGPLTPPLLVCRLQVQDLGYTPGIDDTRLSRRDQIAEALQKAQQQRQQGPRRRALQQLRSPAGGSSSGRTARRLLQ